MSDANIRWLIEMCDDHRLPHDDSLASRRRAINTFIHSLRAALAEAGTLCADLSCRLKMYTDGEDITLDECGQYERRCDKVAEWMPPMSKEDLDKVFGAAFVQREDAAKIQEVRGDLMGLKPLPPWCHSGLCAEVGDSKAACQAKGCHAVEPPPAEPVRHTAQQADDIHKELWGFSLHPEMSKPPPAAKDAEIARLKDALADAQNETEKMRLLLREAQERNEQLRAEVAQFRSLLIEWRRTPFFATAEEWRTWVHEFGARVDAALGAKEDA